LKTDSLIEALTQDAPVRTRFGPALVLATAGGIAFVGAAFFGLLGFRPDIGTAIGTVRFLFKLLLTFALAASALGIVSRFARPGRHLGVWRWALAAVPVLLLAALACELAVTPPSLWMKQLIGRNSLHCLSLIPLFAMGPLAALLYALRQGAPARPGLAGLLAGLAASGIAAIFYATNCTDDSPLFVATWYSLATAVVAGIGYLAGSRLLRW
jgi:hypothetical protein